MSPFLTIAFVLHLLFDYLSLTIGFSKSLFSLNDLGELDWYIELLISYSFFLSGFLRCPGVHW